MSHCPPLSCVVVSPGPRVGVGVPGLLLHSKGSLRQNGTEPRRDVFADVIDLVRVLTRASGAVLVRLVLQDLHPAALATALLSALFLQNHDRTEGGGRCRISFGLSKIKKHVILFHGRRFSVSRKGGRDKMVENISTNLSYFT